jgi:protein-S-isoprenylcysteine O-methyltransferase Ste14
MNLETLWTSLYLAWIGIEIVIAVATTRSRGERNVQDRGTQLVLWAAIILSLTLSGWMRHLGLADMHLSEYSLLPASLAIFAAGLTVRIVAIFTLGKWFSANVTTYAAQTIQRKGLYKYVRHPSYLGMEIIFFAIGLHTHDLACMAAALIPSTLAVIYRIHVEETALLGAFGSEYAEYMRTAKRLIPGVY